MIKLENEEFRRALITKITKLQTEMELENQAELNISIKTEASVSDSSVSTSQQKPKLEETKSSLIENLEEVVSKMHESLVLAGKKKTTIKDFASLKVLGTGTYGKVMLVRHKQS